MIGIEDIRDLITRKRVEKENMGESEDDEKEAIMRKSRRGGLKLLGRMRE